MKIQEWLGNENKLGMDIWERKYRFKDETFEDWLERVSNGNEELKELIRDKKFLFGGRILSNRGLQNHGRKVTYSNCYVAERPDDSIEGIFDTAKKVARTFSYGGGIGVDLANLAPRGAKIRNSAKETTGAVSFMTLYDLTTGLIGQNGRRGALMLSMPCNHPDLEEFITVKSEEDAITKANISVRFDDEFMEAVRKNELYDLYFEREETGEKIVKRVNAREILYKFAKNNHDWGEPGALFWDRVTNWGLLSEYPDDLFEGVNPCGEEPLIKWGACLLGSFNLRAYVKTNEYGGKYFDVDEFNKDVGTVVRAMNEVLDEGMDLHPLKEQRESAKNWRQIGIGVMGIADMLIELGITYGSTEAVQICDSIGSNLAMTALETSAILAKKYGPFPQYDEEYVLNSGYFLDHVSPNIRRLVEKYGLRNSQLLTIAPTGSLSTMLGISGGIEPIYAISYKRKTESIHDDDKYYEIFTPIAKKYMEENNLDTKEQLPPYFVASKDIPTESRIAMQSVWQRHIDAAISSTINLPEGAGVEDIMDIYVKAWEEGLKGVTVFRDNCKKAGILTEGDVQAIDLNRGDWSLLADDTVYYPEKVYIGCGKIKLMIGWSEKEQALQDFYVIRVGKGGCERNLQGMVIAMSGMLRLGGNLMNIEKAFEGMGACNSFSTKRASGGRVSKGGSCGSAILNAIKDFIKEKTGEEPQRDKPIAPIEVENGIKCPYCGEVFEGATFMAEGCFTCPSCGNSKCD